MSAFSLIEDAVGAGGFIQQITTLANLGAVGAVLAAMVILLRNQRAAALDNQKILETVVAGQTKVCEAMEASHSRAQDRLGISLDKLSESIKDVVRKA